MVRLQRRLQHQQGSGTSGTCLHWQAVGCKAFGFAAIHVFTQANIFRLIHRFAYCFLDWWDANRSLIILSDQ
jgi:hypothetical protein